jgi:alcohol dehydrogenase YqhD (iron-dependent ADH family)
MEWGPRAIADGKNPEARAQVQWASIVALNGWVNAGTNGGYPVHMIEHTLSAHHDVSHGAGLAVINPSWMRFAARHKPAKFVQFAERIFGLQAKGPDDLECALQGIDAFEAFLRRIGCPTRLAELGIGDTLIQRYAQDTLRVIHDENGRLPGRPAMDEADIVAVLRAAL